jgi:HAMP domain-containing protein
MGDAAANARARSLPLRARFLLALPVINVVTGVAVAGLSDPGGGDLGDLGADVLVAVGVAFTLSLWLSVSLARSVTVPIRDLRRATDRVAQGDLSARVPVISTDEVGRLAASFNGAVRGLGERERLREAFGAFVDPVLADRVLEEGTTLAGEEVDVTIMFLDIRSFTAFAERVDPAQVVETLNDTGDDLLITEATRARLRREHGTFAPRPDVALRGKARPQRLWTPTAQTLEAVSERLAVAAADGARPERPRGKATASPRRVWPARPRGCARSDRACAGDRNAGRELRRSRRVRRAHAGRVRCASPLSAERARSR